eukprot:Skav236725  [mRNA]  locus=scaffold2023:93245:94566:- [translate_table: standard]
MEQTLAANVHKMGLQNSWPRKEKGAAPYQGRANLRHANTIGKGKGRNNYRGQTMKGGAESDYSAFPESTGLNLHPDGLPFMEVHSSPNAPDHVVYTL